MTKVIYAREMSESDNYYLEYLTLGYKVIWEDKIINFPYETQDLEAMIENQKNSKVSLRRLTPLYKDNLEYMMLDMFPEIKSMQIKNILRNLEKEE